MFSSQLLQYNIKFHPNQLESVGENRTTQALLCAALANPSQGLGQWKWYKMVEVNGACKYVRYEKKLVEKFACNVQC